MAYAIGEAATIFDVIEAMDSLLQSVGWVREQVKYTTYNGTQRINYCFWRGLGDGNDNIYLQVWIPEERHGKTNYSDMLIDSSAGFDDKLAWWEQPGSLQQWHKKYEDDDGTLNDVLIPMFTISPESRYYYWLFADSYHITGICRMSIVYESFYCGFLNPIANERQFPYPMYIAGNSYATGASWPSNDSGSFIFPNNGSGWLRRADGVWRSFSASHPNPSPDTLGTVFPYTAANQKLIPNYREQDAIEQNNFLLIPVMLQMNDPVDIAGLLRNVYWVSGTRDIDAEKILVIDNEQYIVFDRKQDRLPNSYFCVKME